MAALVLATAGTVSAQSRPIGPVGSAAVYSNPALYAEGKAEWLARLEASPQDVDVLEGAAQYLIIFDRPLAQDLLERGRALDPRNPRWSEKLADLHKLNAANGDVAEAVAALADAERAHSLAPPNNRTVPAGLAEAAFDAGDYAKAAAYAKQLLDEAITYRTRWDYGNAIHKGNLVLGRIAVRDGRLAEAVTFLRASGQTPGSPQLNSFGPNMSLAKDLLDLGETQAVLDYFVLCRKFWTMGASRLDAWTAAVQAGNVPSFGANLHY
jgi:tetratricopeptide (TPR) repeat protein